MDNDLHNSPNTAEPQPATSPEHAGDVTLTRRQLLVGAGVGMGALALLGAALFRDRFTGSDEAGGLVFVIPKGARAKVNDSTLYSAITLPTYITFAPGEKASITVRNEDEVPLRAGPFIVQPGQVYVQRFPNPGEFNIACSVDPRESIKVIVEA